MSTEDARKLFVAGLPDSITEDVLRQLFEAAGGTVVNVSLPRDRATGRPRGFGFVTLSSADEAARTRQSLDGSMQAGRSISVRPFSSEPPRRTEGRPETPAAPVPDDRTVYVGNLPYDATQAELEQLFREKGVGPVVRMHLPSGADGRARGFGFITMANAEAANEAIVALRNADIRGRRLMINIAHPRAERGAERGPSPERMDRRPRPMPSEAREHVPPSPEIEFVDVPEVGESARPLEGRRARGAEVKKKKKERGKKRGTEDKARSRGGGNSWQNWDDWDED